MELVKTCSACATDGRLCYQVEIAESYNWLLKFVK